MLQSTPASRVAILTTRHQVTADPDLYLDKRLQPQVWLVSDRFAVS